MTNDIEYQEKCEGNRALLPDQVLATSASTKDAFVTPSNFTHSTSRQHQHLANHQMFGATKDRRLHLNQQSSKLRQMHMQNPALINGIRNRTTASDPTIQTDALNWPALDDSAVPTTIGPGLISTQGHLCNAGGVEAAAGVGSRYQDELGDFTFNEIGGTAVENDQTFHAWSETNDDSIQMLFDNSFDMWSTLWDGLEG